MDKRCTTAQKVARMDNGDLLKRVALALREQQPGEIVIVEKGVNGKLHVKTYGRKS